MTRGLKRYQGGGDLHFVTFSCFQRRQYLGSPQVCARFEEALERARLKYRFCVIGYVVMPEHVHLLLSEPTEAPLSGAFNSLKLSVSKLSNQHPFWQSRYYDFNVFTTRKQVEKLRYLHRNPVTRGLVSRPEDWPWSSFQHYATGQRGTVEIESFWTAALREAKENPTLADSQKTRIAEGGAPGEGGAPDGVPISR
jgi:putative transposase